MSFLPIVDSAEDKTVIMFHNVSFQQVFGSSTKEKKFHFCLLRVQCTNQMIFYRYIKKTYITAEYWRIADETDSLKSWFFVFVIFMQHIYAPFKVTSNVF